MKPRAFIGSSVESLTIAYTIQEILEYQAEITIWDQGVFEPSKYTLEALNEVLNNIDFGIFILGADDLVKLREVEYQTTRDNVILELGLFIGRLGRERNFIVIPRGIERFHLPTDLLGLTPVQFDPNRQDGNLVAALGPACHRIGTTMAKVGSAQAGVAGQQEQAKNAAVKKSQFEMGEWIAGWWWQTVYDGSKRSLSFTKIEQNSDTDSVRISGQVYKNTAETTAFWRAQACVLTPALREISYIWRGEILDEGQGMYGGFGEIVFEENTPYAMQGNGFFSDCNLGDFTQNRKKSILMVRVSDVEIAVMQGGVKEPIRQLILEKLASLSGDLN